MLALNHRTDLPQHHHARDAIRVHRKTLPQTRHDAHRPRGWLDRHSKVVVRGQRAIGYGPEALEIEADAADGAVTRNRSILVVEPGDVTKLSARYAAATARRERR